MADQAEDELPAKTKHYKQTKLTFRSSAGNDKLIAT